MGSVVYDETVYFGSYDEYLYALNIKTGKMKWKFKTLDAVYSYPVLHNEMLYLAGRDRNLYAITPDGNLKWIFRSSSLNSLPVVDKDKLYMSSFYPDQHIYALTSEGDVIWKFHSSHIPWNMAVNNQNLYNVGFDGYTFSITTNGKFRWEFKTRSPYAPSLEGVTPPPKWIGIGRWFTLFANKDFKLKEPSIYDRTFNENGEVRLGEYVKTEITGYERGVGSDYKSLVERADEAKAKKKRIEEALREQHRW